MHSQQPISICIPSYNSEEFIVATFESALPQSFTDFRVFIVDDKSTECTVSIMEQFGDPRITPIENEQNPGRGANWHEVLSRAHGECVKLLGDDDIPHPGCLSRQVAGRKAPMPAPH